MWFFYWIFGMSTFDSISHAMTTIATGGFSTHNESIGFFKNSNIEIVASIFIILGSMPFISYLKFVQGNKKVFSRCANKRFNIFASIINYYYVSLFNIY